jgi:drug/metabolite transporter (DMT)-like permease
MLIAFFGIGLFLAVSKGNIFIPLKKLFKYLVVGFIVAGHWIFFFEAIKVSNVSVTLACLSSTTLFVSFIEPFFFKRKIVFYEVFLGALVIVGLSLIFSFESEYWLGIIYALIAAFLAALFGTINGVLVRNDRPRIISFYEMLGGVIGISSYLFFADKITELAQLPKFIDLFYLSILGLICTAFAFVVSVEVLKYLSPFTVSISINMEPIYAIILALLFFGEDEKMTFGFYCGALLILSTIFANGWLKAKNNSLFRRSLN